MLKVGLSSYSLSRAISNGEMDIFGAIKFTAERGGKHIEIVPGNSYVVTGNDQLAADIVKAVKAAGMEISSYTIGANFMLPTAEEIKKEIARVKKEVDTAAKLGVTRMRHDAGWRPVPETTCEQFEKDLVIAVDACGEIADYAKQYGITTSVENHGFHFQGSERIQRLVLGVNRDNFRTTMDVGNFLCVDEDPEVAAMNNIRFASMVHFKDFHIRRTPPCKDGYIPTAHGRFIRGAITGDGDVNLAAIVKIIKNADYDGFLSIEYEGWEECKSACDRAMKNVLALVENN